MKFRARASSVSGFALGKHSDVYCTLPQKSLGHGVSDKRVPAVEHALVFPCDRITWAQLHRGECSFDSRRIAQEAKKPFPQVHRFGLTIRRNAIVIPIEAQLAGFAANHGMDSTITRSLVRHRRR